MSAKLPADDTSIPLKTVLVIDPDPAVSAMLATVLDPLNWSIQHTRDNKTALDLIGHRSFDLIITGEKTSHLEDVELLRKNRRVRPHTRMIILTDASTPADVIACIQRTARIILRIALAGSALPSLGKVPWLAASTFTAGGAAKIVHALLPTVCGPAFRPSLSRGSPHPLATMTSGFRALYKKFGEAALITLSVAHPNLGGGRREYLLLLYELHAWFAKKRIWKYDSGVKSGQGQAKTSRLTYCL